MSELLQASARLAVLLPALTAVLALRRRPPARGWPRGLATTGRLPDPARDAGQVPSPYSGRVPRRGDHPPALPLGGSAVPLHLLADRTSAVIAVAVAIVGLAVQVFIGWYLRDDPATPSSRPRSPCSSPPCCWSSSRTTSCSRLVGWEVMGWCSYLLIGHVSARESARRAAFKAFLVTRVADIGFVVGLVILAVGAGTTDIGTVMAHWAAAGAATAALVTGTPVLTAALVCCSPASRASPASPVPRLAPRRHGGPDARVRAHPRGDDGRRRHLRRRPPARPFRRSDTARIVLGVLAARDDGLGRAARLRARATSSGCWPTPRSARSRSWPARSPSSPPGSASTPALHLFSHALFKSLLFLAVGWLSVLAGGTAFVDLRGGRGRGALYWSPYRSVGLAVAGRRAAAGRVLLQGGRPLRRRGGTGAADVPGGPAGPPGAVRHGGADRGVLHARRGCPHPAHARGGGGDRRARGGGRAGLLGVGRVPGGDGFGPVFRRTQVHPGRSCRRRGASTRPDLRGRPPWGVAAGGPHRGRRRGRAARCCAWTPRRVVAWVPRCCSSSARASRSGG